MQVGSYNSAAIEDSGGMLTMHRNNATGSRKKHRAREKAALLVQLQVLGKEGPNNNESPEEKGELKPRIPFIPFKWNKRY